MRPKGLLQAALESERRRTWRTRTGSAEQSDGALSASDFSLSSLLVCEGCDRPLQPSYITGGVRSYVFLCGCQRVPVDAGLVERLARDRVETASVDLVTGVLPERLRLVFEGLFAQIRIGASPDELEFVWRV